MNKKCIYYDTCWESRTECLYGKECEDYEPITERRGNKAERNQGATMTKTGLRCDQLRGDYQEEKKEYKSK